jgi:chemotaxis regulatin CheY-phosphate phosphatase CheZ
METRENARYIILANVAGKKTAIQVDGLYKILPPQNFPLQAPKEIQYQDERLPLYGAGKIIAFFEKGSSQETSYEELYRELLAKVKELSDDIVHLKQSIVADFADDLTRITKDHIPSTSGQLAAILSATEEAANNIMDLTEKVQASQQKLAEKFGGLRNSLAQIKKEEDALTGQIEEMDEITSENNTDLTKIVTSLSFHDLTGQQLQKTMKLQNELEEKLISILFNFGIKLRKTQDPEDEAIERGEKMLDRLRGPNREAIEQEEVDHILADFLK